MVSSGNSDSSSFLMTSAIVFKCQKGEVNFFPENNKLQFLNPETPDVEISYAASKTLELLIINAGRVVARTALFNYAWAGKFVTQNSLNQVISQLRDSLGDDIEKRVIKTVSGQGYMFLSTCILDLSKNQPVVDCNESPKENVLLTDDNVLLVGTSAFSLSSLFTNIRAFQIVTIILSSLFWFWRLDLGLFFSSGYVTEVHKYTKTSVVYVATSDELLKKLKLQFSALIDRVDADNANSKTIVVNDSLGYYDIYCLSPNEDAKFIFISKDASINISSKTLSKCLN